MRQRCPLFFSKLLKFLARAISQEKKRKRESNRNGRSQIISICLCLKDLKNSTKTFLNLINTFDNIVGYKTNIQKPFLYTNNEEAEKEIRKLISFTIASRKIK
jgi:hypothetical protein